MTEINNTKIYDETNGWGEIVAIVHTDRGDYYMVVFDADPWNSALIKKPT